MGDTGPKPLLLLSSGFLIPDPTSLLINSQEESDSTSSSLRTSGPLPCPNPKFGDPVKNGGQSEVLGQAE